MKKYLFDRKFWYKGLRKKVHIKTQDTKMIISNISFIVNQQDNSFSVLNDVVINESQYIMTNSVIQF